MTILFLALWLQMSAQLPPSTPAGYIQCWNDSTTHDYMCQDGYGRHVDVTQALIKLMAADETDGKPPKCANGSNCYCGDTGCRDYTQQEWDEYLRIMAEPVEPEKPAEPVDVPAVRHEDNRRFYCGIGGVSRCDHGEFLPKGNSGLMCGYDAAAKKLEASCGKATYTCADKSRVLLTSEDGKKHCIKF